MSPHHADTGGVTVDTEANAVVVTVPADAALDSERAQNVNQQFMDCVQHDHVTGALTVLHTENPLSGDVFEAVEAAARAAADEGVTRWAIVVEERVKGMAFSSQISGIETELFEDETEAFDWLAAA